MKHKKPVYLDYNATTPVDPKVAEVMLPYLTEHFGNPSSSHEYGRVPKQAVDLARKQVAEMLHANPDEIIFTSGGSESNNYAIKGAAYANQSKGRHIITSSVEHPAVLEVCAYLQEDGFEVTYLPVDETGLISLDDVEKAITPHTTLISVMHANNEIGTIQPIAELAELARMHEILIHSDCAQSVGKIPVRVDELQVDLFSVAGHKLYAPKGIGVLYVRRGVHLQKQMHGADHERNWRAGTENVLEIVGLGKACALVNGELEQPEGKLIELRNDLEKQILEKIPTARINGNPDNRLPNTSSISFPHLEANTIVSELNDTVAVSAGAACHAESVEVSTVLQAIRLPLEYAMGTIRFSVGRFSTQDELDYAISEVERVVKNLQPSDTSQVPGATVETVKLTQFTHGLGCACKLRPQVLEEVLKKLPPVQDKKVLVGTETSDDAAVYQIDSDTAIVQTVDFFTPIVDDPFDFGRIAAANALSDVYAMGAKPLFALNLVSFPSNRLPMKVLENILLGAQQVAEQAGISILGGHTVDDTEPKYGMAVTGTVHPHKIIRNEGAKQGDMLVLTKPLGTGILSTAQKRGLLSSKQLKEMVELMATLNQSAARAMQSACANACTDVTGFGLLGHLREMLLASGCSADLYMDKIPLIDGTEEFSVNEIIPGGTKDNFTFTEADVSYDEDIADFQKYILNDAQTSGGLLIALPERNLVDLLQNLSENQVPEQAVIGTVSSGQAGTIRVRKSSM